MQTSRNRYRCVGSSDPSLSSAARIEAPVRVENHDRERPQEINGEGEFPSPSQYNLFRFHVVDMPYTAIHVDIPNEASAIQEAGNEIIPAVEAGPPTENTVTVPARRNQ